VVDFLELILKENENNQILIVYRSDDLQASQSQEELFEMFDEHQFVVLHG
jgi:hypothetical protein